MIATLRLSEPTPIGSQMLVAGVASITPAMRLALRAAEPMRPRKAQKPADHGLFDLAARDRLDLFNAPRTLP